MIVNAMIRVTNIRSIGEYGGAIFSGYEVDENGNIVDAYKPVVAVADNKVITCKVFKGEVWFVTGKYCLYKGVRDGYKYQEEQIVVNDAYRKSICGDNFIDFVSSHEAFAGIGRGKAEKIWTGYQEEVYEHLDSHNVEAFTKYLTHEKSKLLVNQWGRFGFSSALEWLDRMNIPSKMGSKVFEYYGAKTKEKIEEDPYRILAFGAQWKAVDTVAREQLYVSENDPRRLLGAIEESLFRSFKKGRKKSTALTRNELRDVFSRVIKEYPSTAKLSNKTLLDMALSIQLGNQVYVSHSNLYQHLGAYHMEKTAANKIKRIMDAEKSISFSDFDIGQIIGNYEEEFAVRLTLKQRESVNAAAHSPFLALSGGAGTGKTTVLKCIYRVLSVKKINIIQMALLGRAAKRMTESTGLAASTIAAFMIKYNGKNSEPFPVNTCVVIDEASMVDIIHFWRIMMVLPEDSRVIMVGDPKQLPPIGPGLVFHSLAGNELITNIHLDVVKRNAKDSVLPQIAGEIRNHCWPDLPQYTGLSPNASFLSCEPRDIDKTVLKVFHELGGDSGDVKVICSIKNNRQGTKAINLQCHEHYRKDDDKVLPAIDESSHIFVGNSFFKVNDSVMFTRNDYSRELMNGTQGKIIEKMDPNETGCICRVDFEGIHHDMTVDDLEDLELAYAITCHKSQGSQYKRVIVPIIKNINLDQSLIYTAITRGVEQVVFVGQVEDARKAVILPTVATQRTTGFMQLLHSELKNDQHVNKQ